MMVKSFYIRNAPVIPAFRGLRPEDPDLKASILQNANSNSRPTLQSPKKYLKIKKNSKKGRSEGARR